MWPGGRPKRPPRNGPGRAGWGGGAGAWTLDLTRIARPHIIPCFLRKNCSHLNQFSRSVSQKMSGGAERVVVCVSFLMALQQGRDRITSEFHNWKLFPRLDVQRSELSAPTGRYPSGQRGQTVNLLPSASKVRILACPPHQACWVGRTQYIGRPSKHLKWKRGGRSSVVESQPSKLVVAGSNPVARSI